MTDDDLAAIAAAEAAATPGDWRPRNQSYQCHVDVCLRDSLYTSYSGYSRWISVLGPALEHEACVANAAFIAGSLVWVPQLLPEVGRLRAALERIREHEGRVCPEFETCRHMACLSSHASLEIADAALCGGEQP
jgi:hypothetical protein